MSRDKRLNRTQEVVGSIPISSTNSNDLADVQRHCLQGDGTVWRRVRGEGS